MQNHSTPNRWLHIRQPAGFSAEMFDVFKANAEIFIAHANALLSVWHRFPGNSVAPRYSFFPAELSQDLTVATLPIGGESTLGARAAIENANSYLLWQHFPMQFMEGLEEGLTETFDQSVGSTTNWRTPAPSITFMHADPEFRRRFVI